MMMNCITVEQARDMFCYVGEKIIESKPLLTDIDRVIGDGDHGIGMSIGFTTAIQNLEKNEITTINEIFKTVGMSMINSMGGASGIIFGTMFVGAVKGEPPIKQLNLTHLAALFDNSVKAIQQRGKASLGDKTMIDALDPAVQALQECSSSSASFHDGLEAAEKAARVGVENTKNYIAKFGRSKTLGERSIGHQDAGATSVWIIFRSMHEWVKRNLPN